MLPNQQLLVTSTFLIILLLRPVLCDEQCIVTKFDQVPDAVKNCKDIVLSELEVPGGEQLVLHLTEGTSLSFRGRITFGYSEWTGPLVSLRGVNITIRGEEGSILDGQGSLYWDGHGTGLNNNKPRFFKVSVQNAVLENINVLNCPVLCILIRSSDDLVVRNWSINNLEGGAEVKPQNNTAHNTDGFNVEDTNNTLIEHSVVYNQDDCVVVASGRNVTVRNMFCHGSHGLSVRGVGAVLENVLFADSLLTMGQNGIHVKTAPNGGQGLIRNITYRNITILDSSKYGINIQQNYPNKDETPKNNIPIYNLNLNNIYGNVQNGAVPVFVMCAKDGCFDWHWQEVTIFGTSKNNCTNYVPQGYNNC